MKINEVIGEWIIMPQSIKPLGLIRKPGGGFDFKNKVSNSFFIVKIFLCLSQLVLVAQA